MSEEGEMNPNQSATPFFQMILENGKNSRRNGIEKEERESFRVLEEGRLGPKTRETELRLGPPGDYQTLNCPSPVSKNGRNQKLSGQETGLLRQQPAFSLYQKSLHQKTATFFPSKQASPSILVRETANPKMETQKTDERETILLTPSAPSNLDKPNDLECAIVRLKVQNSFCQFLRHTPSRWISHLANKSGNVILVSKVPIGKQKTSLSSIILPHPSILIASGFI
ncbi:hypothetical protein AMTRI_Chr11g95160 [Amborella trichopoda]